MRKDPKVTAENRQRIDRTFFGNPAPHDFVHQVFFINRGRAPASVRPPLSMDEWLTCIDAQPALVRDECYLQYHIHLEVTQVWREVGRARWLASPADSEYLHFSPARIEYIHDGIFRGGPSADKYASIMTRLPQPFFLEDWLAVAEKDHFLALDPESAEPGRAVWLTRNGRVKHVFRYTPPSVWMFKWPVGSDTPDMHVQARKDFCSKLVRRMDAELWDGLGNAL